VHLLARSIDALHAPQVFRMRSSHCLNKLAVAYSIFRRLGPGEADKFTMSSERHGNLDPSRPVSAYGFCDGDHITFSAISSARASASDQESLVQMVPSGPADRGSGKKTNKVETAEHRGTGRRRRSAKASACVKEELPSQARRDAKGSHVESVAAVAHSRKLGARPKAKAKAKAKLTNSVDAIVSIGSKDSAVDLTPQVLGKPCVQRGLMRSMTAKSGPARGWRLYAWLAERKGQSKAVRWRSVSPQRTRAFDNFRSLRESVSEGVYTHIHEGLRPQLLPKIRTRRRDLECHGSQKPVIPLMPEAESASAKPPSTGSQEIVPHPPSTSTPPRKRKATASPASEPPSRKRQLSAKRALVGRSPSSKDKPPRKRLRPLNAKELRMLPPSLQNMSTQVFEPLDASRHGLATLEHSASASSQLATQVLQPAVGGHVASVSSEVASQAIHSKAPRQLWECECKAHLHRHPRCTNFGELQPQVIHLCGSRMVIGRLKSCDVVIDSVTTPQMISRRHAMLKNEGGTFELHDQGAVNGMSINGKRLKAAAACTLQHGDVVTFGIATERPELDYVFEEQCKLLNS